MSVWRFWPLVAVVVAGSAMAETVRFNAHSIEVDDAGGGRKVLAMHGSAYSIPGSPAQVIGKAQACLARRDSGVGIISVDAANGRLLGISRTRYRSAGSDHILRSRWNFEAGEGSFSVRYTDLAEVREQGATEVYDPLPLLNGGDWEEALAPVVALEQVLLDCMYR